MEPPQRKLPTALAVGARPPTSQGARWKSSEVPLKQRNPSSLSTPVLGLVLDTPTSSRMLKPFPSSISSTSKLPKDRPSPLTPKTALPPNPRAKTPDGTLSPHTPAFAASTSALATPTRSVDETPSMSSLRLTHSHFKSDALSLEIQLSEMLQSSNAAAAAPCPIRMKIFEQIFQAVIDSGSPFSSLLTAIKNEYETTLRLGPRAHDQMAFDALTAETSTLKMDLQQSSAREAALQKQVAELSAQTGALAAQLAASETEVKELNQRLLEDNPVWRKQKHLQRHWAELDEDISRTLKEAEEYKAKTARKTAGKPTSSEQSLEGRVRELEAELRISRNRERQLYDTILHLKQQVPDLAAMPIPEPSSPLQSAVPLEMEP
eukprot:GCRY01004113.1.p1 GENE.GCRY01004113.1~~GCRY01004113.1.p1  ORF type:complete len:377 (-),score=106.62 GCRY01004113.1:190-1320(-)